MIFEILPRVNYGLGQVAFIFISVIHRINIRVFLFLMKSQTDQKLFLIHLITVVEQNRYVITFIIITTN